MEQDNLKHYDKYIRLLETFAKALGVKIKYSARLDNDGQYSPVRKCITLAEDMSETSTLATLLHEVGHCLDDMSIRDHTLTDKAYIAFYEERFTPQQRRLVLRREKTAWSVGLGLANLLRIRIGKWYFKEEESALTQYRAIKSKLKRSK